MDAGQLDADTACAAVNPVRLDDQRQPASTAPTTAANKRRSSAVCRKDPVISAWCGIRCVKGLPVCGRSGRCSSFNDGDDWQPLLDMPATSIRDLVIRNDDVVVGLHLGRSFWILDDITPLRQIDAEVTRRAAAPVSAPGGLPGARQPEPRPRRYRPMSRPESAGRGTDPLQPQKAVARPGDAGDPGRERQGGAAFLRCRQDRANGREGSEHRPALRCGQRPTLPAGRACRFVWDLHYRTATGTALRSRLFITTRRTNRWVRGRCRGSMWYG